MRLIILLGIVFLSLNTSNAQDVPNLFALGNQAMNSGLYRDAQQYYQAALAKEPLNWSIQTMLAFSIHKQKRFKDADSIYRYVLINDSGNSKAHWYKGMNHIALRQDSLAIIHYKKFIQLEKNKGTVLIQAHRAIGQCYERLLKKDGLYSWQIDEMIYHYEQIERIDPSNIDVPVIRNFIELLKSRRPSEQTGKWKMEP
jgi:tetratricopeptide (TPR) repeat protein